MASEEGLQNRIIKRKVLGMTPEEYQAFLIEHHRVVQWYQDTMKTWWGKSGNSVYLVDEDSFKEIEGISDFHVVDGGEE